MPFFEQVLDWRRYKVIFIDKPGKAKVRPIALSSCVSKLLERMINERLIYWAERKGILAMKQNGFRRSKGCADNILEIYADIKARLLRKQHTVAAFLDVSSAYDNIIRSILIHQL